MGLPCPVPGMRAGGVAEALAAPGFGAPSRAGAVFGPGCFAVGRWRPCRWGTVMTVAPSRQPPRLSVSFQALSGVIPGAGSAVASRVPGARPVGACRAPVRLAPAARCSVCRCRQAGCRSGCRPGAVPVVAARCAVCRVASLERGTGCRSGCGRAGWPCVQAQFSSLARGVERRPACRAACRSPVGLPIGRCRPVRCCLSWVCCGRMLLVPGAARPDAARPSATRVPRSRSVCRESLRSAGYSARRGNGLAPTPLCGVGSELSRQAWESVFVRRHRGWARGHRGWARVDVAVFGAGLAESPCSVCLRGEAPCWSLPLCVRQAPARVVGSWPWENCWSSRAWTVRARTP